jgi:hypothetical protein
VNRKGCGRKHLSWPNLRYCPGIYPQGLGKTMEILSQDSRSLDGHSNQNLPNTKQECQPLGLDVQWITYLHRKVTDCKVIYKMSCRSEQRIWLCNMFSFVYKKSNLQLMNVWGAFPIDTWCFRRSLLSMSVNTRCKIAGDRVGLADSLPVKNSRARCSWDVIFFWMLACKLRWEPRACW